MEQISYKIAEFEGPLDLLLFLISKHKLNIYDIEIFSLVDQYLSAINEMKEANLEVSSAFLEMASRLIYIKTVMLLPKHEEGEALKKELEGRLLEYSLVKTAAAHLAPKYRGNVFFIREPMDIDFDKTYKRVHESSELLSAFADACGKAQRRLPPPAESFSGIVSHKIVSVFSRTIFVLKNVLRRGRVSFNDLFRKPDRSENVATFLAVLELIKSKKLHISDEGELFLRSGARNSKKSS
jgi:segregation and condensation protein A